MVCGGALALAFIGGLAATRLHYKCRPPSQGENAAQTTADSPFLGAVWGPAERSGTLMNAPANAIAMTVHVVGLRSLESLRHSGWWRGAGRGERAGLRVADRPRRV